MTGETGLGTVTLHGGRQRGREGFVRLAVIFSLLMTATLAAGFAARWGAVEHAPFGNLYELTTAFAFGVAAAHVGFARWPRSGGGVP